MQSGVSASWGLRNPPRYLYHQTYHCLPRSREYREGTLRPLIFLVWLAIKRTDSGEAELRFMTQSELLGER